MPLLFFSRSLLYSASDAFESVRPVLPLEMERYFSAMPSVLSMYAWLSIRLKTEGKEHGDFGDHKVTRLSGLRRFLEQGWPGMLVAVSTAACSPGTLLGAEIVLEQPAVLKLLEKALFTREGKFDLKSGVCYAYLESPSVSLAAGRVIVRSHLSSRTGVEVGKDCVGVGLSSWTVVSGAPVSQDGFVRLQDIRIDEVEDLPSRVLLRSGLLPKLPSAIEIDVKKSVVEMLSASAKEFQAHLKRFNLAVVQAEDNRLTLQFDFQQIAK